MTIFWLRTLLRHLNLSTVLQQVFSSSSAVLNMCHIWVLIIYKKLFSYWLVVCQSLGNLVKFILHLACLKGLWPLCIPCIDLKLIQTASLISLRMFDNLNPLGMIELLCTIGSKDIRPLGGQHLTGDSLWEKVYVKRFPCNCTPGTQVKRKHLKPLLEEHIFIFSLIFSAFHALLVYIIPIVQARERM